MNGEKESTILFRQALSSWIVEQMWSRLAVYAMRLKLQRLSNSKLACWKFALCATNSWSLSRGCNPSTKPEVLDSAANGSTQRPSRGGGVTLKPPHNATTNESHDQLRRHLADFLTAYNFVIGELKAEQSRHEAQ